MPFHKISLNKYGVLLHIDRHKFRKLIKGLSITTRVKNHLKIVKFSLAKLERIHYLSKMSYVTLSSNRQYMQYNIHLPVL